MFSLHKISHGVNASGRVYREWKRREGRRARQDDWIVRGAYYLPQGPWLNGSSSRRLPTKHPWRKSCAPHNNTTAPGHPHTGNLRSLPPFQEIQTHSCCQPRAPTAYWRGRWLPGRKTRRHKLKRISELWENIQPKPCDFPGFHRYSSQKCKRCVPDRFFLAQKQNKS